MRSGFSRSASTLTTATDSSVQVINGGQNCNVFWQVGSSATLGTSTTFIGNILALTSITLTTGASVSGRTGAKWCSDAGYQRSSPSQVLPRAASRRAHARQGLQPGHHQCGRCLDPHHHLDPTRTPRRHLSAPLTDTLPAGVVIAATPNAGTTCGGAGTVAAIAAPRGDLARGRRSRPAHRQLHGDGERDRAAAGSYINTLPAGALQTSNGSNAAPAVATLTVSPNSCAHAQQGLQPGHHQCGRGLDTHHHPEQPQHQRRHPDGPAHRHLAQRPGDRHPAECQHQLRRRTTVTAAAGGTTVTLPAGRSIPATAPVR